MLVRQQMLHRGPQSVQIRTRVGGAVPLLGRRVPLCPDGRGIARLLWREVASEAKVAQVYRARGRQEQAGRLEIAKDHRSGVAVQAAKGGEDFQRPGHDVILLKGRRRRANNTSSVSPG